MDLGHLVAIAPAFYQLSTLNGNVVVTTAAPLEAQLQTRRATFCQLLRNLTGDVTPIDVQPKSPAIKRTSPAPSPVRAQERIDALLGHHHHHNDSTTAAVPAATDPLREHIAAAEARGRTLEALAARHRAHRPLLRMADEAIDVLRSHFNMQKRASLPLDEVLSTLGAALDVKREQARAVVEHLAAAVPEWLTRATFRAEEFVSIKPLSQMSTNAVHELLQSRQVHSP